MSSKTSSADCASGLYMKWLFCAGRIAGANDGENQRTNSNNKRPALRMAPLLANRVIPSPSQTVSPRARQRSIANVRISLEKRTRFGQLSPSALALEVLPPCHSERQPHPSTT